MNNVAVMTHPAASLTDSMPKRVRTRAAMNRAADSSGSAFDDRWFLTFELPFLVGC